VATAGGAPPVVARAADSTSDESGGGDRPVVRPVRAAAPARPAVQRVARPEPPLQPAATSAAESAGPAPRPSLLRRIVGGFRGQSAPPAEPVPEAPTPPRASVTRLVAPPEPARPRLGLQAAEAEEPISETPALRGTSPERLARMLGTEVQVDAAGNQTVEMPGHPFVPFDTAPRTVSRAEASEGTTPAAVTQDTPAAAPAPAPAPAVDVEQLTETVIETLRRELVIEREQSGGPMDLM
jgi:hypothetical protein